MRRSWTALPFAALLLLTLPASGLASWMLPGTPIRPKDFTLVKHDGLYHLFYLRVDTSLPEDSTARDFGHAVSKDLWYWTQYPTVLPARPTSWDCSQVWAPSIVEQDGVFTMFYTGVSTIPGVTDRWQSIGVATSTDLFTWNPLDAPVYECRDAPWSVCDSASRTNDFRDPFVMPDPAHAGQWLLYYVTRPLADSAGMVVAAASSAGDLAQWSDLGPLWITSELYTYNAIAESPHLFEHNGLWYLFWTTGAGQPLTFATGSDPLGAVGAWTYRGRLSTMLGVDTKAWYASEYLRDGLVDYFAYVLGDRISIMRIAWGTDWRFALVQPDWMHVVRMDWDRGEVAPRDTAVLSIVAANATGASAPLEVVRLRADGSQEPVAPDAVGLPASVPLTGDTTRVTWSARWLPDPADTTRPLRLVVRLTDQTAIAPEIDVAAPPPLVVSALTWDATSVAWGDTARLAVVAENGQDRSVGLEAVRVRGDGSQVPLGLDSLGIPRIVPLVGDTTRVAWASRWFPDSPDTARILRLIVRLGGGGLAAPELGVVGPPPLAVTELAWDSTGVLEGNVTTLSIAAEGWQMRHASLEALRLRDGRDPILLAPDSLGLPSNVPLTGAVTRFTWTAQWGPDWPDTTRLFRVLVRVPGGLAAPELDVIGPPRLLVRSMAWDSARVQHGNVTRLAIVAENWLGREMAIAALRAGKGGATLLPLPLDALGLPAAIPLTADTTRWAWTARWLPDLPDTASVLRLVVRRADETASAPLLEVMRPPAPVLPAPGSLPPEDTPLVLWHRPARFSALAHPVAGGSAMLVDVDQPARARLDIYDAQGRRVRNLADRELPRGATVLVWDGRATDGSAVRAGIYFARLVLPEGARTVRLVRLH